MCCAQGRLGGQEGELASHPFCSGNPDGGHAVNGSVLYIPCPNGVTAVRVSSKPPYLRQLWTFSGASNAPIFADGLVWTIGSDGSVHGVDPKNGRQLFSYPFGGSANHFPTPAVADGLMLLPGMNQVVAFTGPAGLPPAPTAG